MSEQKKCCCGSGKKTNEVAIKEFVKQKYGQIAQDAGSRRVTSCCGKSPAKDAITRDLYSDSETTDIPEEALLASMGCGNPIALAQLNPGEVVLDLGSGGGIDVLLSASRVGPTGKAYGLDMTDEMLALARQNQKAAGVENVEFMKGDIESIPLPDNSVDVIISNCVINLSTDKDAVLKEAFRVLKPGGRFAVADIVMTKPIPDAVSQFLAAWAGCIAGALHMDEYQRKLSAAGFEGVGIEVVRTYTADDAEGLLPEEAVRELGAEGLADMSGAIVSAFIRASKPSKGSTCCCGR
jgi:arsenite methyltransferase